MRAYGNLMNRIAEAGVDFTKPEAGMGATELCYSDRHAYTVVRVDPKGKKLWATQDKATRSDKNGMSDSQSYDYETVPDATEEMFTLRKDGRWHRGTTLGGTVLAVGYRDEYYDFSF